MGKLEQRLAELNALVAQDDFYGEAYKARRPDILAEHGELGKSLSTCEEDWLQLQEQLEALS